MINPNTSGQVYNVTSGEPHKMRYYTETLLKHAKLNDVNQVIDEKLWRPIDIQYQDGDATKLIEEVGWEPEYKIEDTLNDLLNYWIKKINT